MAECNPEKRSKEFTSPMNDPSKVAAKPVKDEVAPAGLKADLANKCKDPVDYLPKGGK